jgi:class 3 adenylate cyclase
MVPYHRAIIAVDIEGSTKRTNPAKARFRQVLYDLIEEALRSTGITVQDCDPPIDRGDGAILLIHPVDHVPKTLLLTALLPQLCQLLGKHNDQQPLDAFRLRAALHAGEILYDRNGPFGEAVDLTCRLLDAPELKTTLRDRSSPMVIVASDDIHRSIIKHRYAGIDDHTFEPLVQLELAGVAHTGWVRTLWGHNNGDAVRLIPFTSST